MNQQATATSRQNNAIPVSRSIKSSNFRLVRYFSVAALAAFLAVAVVLYFLEQRENDYFNQVQHSQKNFVTQIQENFAREQETAARRNLIHVHETGHVNLAQLLANAMWGSHFAPFVSRARMISAEHCRTLAESEPATGATASSSAVPSCFADVGKKTTVSDSMAAPI